jgi:mannose-1-phosphate guanylyltransferase
MRPYTLFLPKAMLPLGDRPVVEHQIEWLKSQGIREIVLAVEYMRKAIEEFFGDGSELGVKISYARSTHPLGTAGQLKTVQKHVHGTFLCIYCDTLLSFQLSEALSLHRSKKALATSILSRYEASLRYGLVDLDKEGRLKKWDEKPKVQGLINTGCFILEPRFLDYIPPNKMFGMDQAFNNAIKADERVYGYECKGEFIDLGDKRSYRQADETFINRIGRIL